MSKKVLPLVTPPVNYLLNHAYVLSVLLNDERAYAWMYSNYIQVYYSKKIDCRFSMNYYLGNMTKYFYNIPFLEVRTMDKEFLLKEVKDPLEFVKHAMEEDYYVMTIADEYHIPGKKKYQKEHFMHLIMFHGYSSEEQCLYSSGYTDMNVFVEQTVSFDDFIKAFLSAEGDNKGIRDHYVMLLRHQDKNRLKFPQSNYNYFEYNFDLDYIKRMLKEYLDSEQTDRKLGMYQNPNQNLSWGITIYENIIQNFDLILSQPKLKQTEYKAFHGLVEHKDMMINRIKYMGENGYLRNWEDLLSCYEGIEKETKILRNNVLRYDFTLDGGLLEKSKVLAKSIKSLEEEVINTMIQRIVCK